MTELQLFKFINKRYLEMHWRGEELILWVGFDNIKDFVDLCPTYFGDGDVNVNLQQHCIALDIVQLCEHYDIEPENILSKEEDD